MSSDTDEQVLDISALQKQLHAFADARNWHQFHSPKNLAMSVSIEAAELLEHFQWITQEASCQIADNSQEKQAVAYEICDVMIYLIMLADKLGIDLPRNIQEKITLNERKHSIDTVTPSV